MSLTISAAHVSPHPKAAAAQLAHARSEDFTESEDWRRLSECMDDHICESTACLILCEAHGPLQTEHREMRSALALTMNVCARSAKLLRSTHGLTSQMYLPDKQDNVGVHMIIVILEAAYRIARNDLFHGLNDGLFKSIYTARRREK